MKVPQITKETLKKILADPETIIIDVRTKKNKYKIPGAFPEDAGKTECWMNQYPRDKKLVLYCSCENQEKSMKTAAALMEFRFDNVYVLKGGWNEWFKSRFPMEMVSERDSSSCALA